MIDVKLYETMEGREPFGEWLASLKCKRAKSRVLKDLNKLETGLVSDSKSCGKGVHEIRLHFDKGYRLYFGYDGDKLIILLIGSHKGNQSKAILKAQQYWADYKKQKKKDQQHGRGESHETRTRINSARTEK